MTHYTTLPVALYFFTVFISGFVILSLEMLGFRFLAPYFGSSTYVWGGLLGVILAALSAGYYFGGILADKKPDGALVFDLILYSTLYLTGVLFFYKDMLDFFAHSGIIWGSIFSSLILFGPTMLLLGMISPFVIKLLAKEDTVGVTSGNIFALSTLGSILGTFFTSFVLIPEAGSFLTLIILTVLLLLLYILGSYRKFHKTLIGTALIIFVLLVPEKKSESRIVFETESAYNVIQVEKNENQYFLYLNDPRWTQSHYLKGLVSSGGYLDFMLLGKFLTDFKDVLILGSGAGVSIRQFLYFSPEVKVDAVELDPKVTEVGRRFFGLVDDPRLKIYTEDARPFLSRIEKQYDLIEADVFSGGPFVPFYLTTREYFELVFQRLRPEGVMLMNVLAVGDDKTFASYLGNTIKSVFPSLFTVDLLKENTLFIAAKEKMSLEQFKIKLQSHPDPVLDPIIQHALDKVVEFRFKEGVPIFTDDRAPVEKLVYEMVKKEYL